MSPPPPPYLPGFNIPLVFAGRLAGESATVSLPALAHVVLVTSGALHRNPAVQSTGLTVWRHPASGRARRVQAGEAARGVVRAVEALHRTSRTLACRARLLPGPPATLAAMQALWCLLLAPAPPHSCLAMCKRWCRHFR